MKADEILQAALDRQSPGERTAYFDGACGADAQLRSLVEELLRAHLAAGSFLEQPLFEPTPTIDHPSQSMGPGTMIGPYKLLQQIGEGGMGTVFMAEQTQPVQRKVAVKIIKAGMDSKHVIARFETERQALALMDHVNIARVFDAGTVGVPALAGLVGPEARLKPGLQPSGLPYFVMELVHGVPITKYCDDNRLTPRERLELFVPVCQAIQHAHQKGIIHRDVKPSNVMVTLYDGKPVPKVIDFGVAKATEQKLTERTLFTQYGTMVGTPQYMSPEQAEMSALGVDTRSDVYSLGVLLYELLTGSTPLSQKRIREAGYGEVLRMIKEEEPPTPSQRLSDTWRVERGARSALRSTLRASRFNELDWIVMKCLEKDRNRRYETASAFATDVQRYLNDEQVQACPPSAGYLLRKFVRRKRRTLVAVALVITVLVGGIIGTTLGMFRAFRAESDAWHESAAKEIARKEAVQEREYAVEAEKSAKEDRDKAIEAETDTKAFSDFLVWELLAVARPPGVRGGLGIDVKMSRALEVAEERIAERFAGRPKAEATARHALGVTWRELTQFHNAEKQLRRAVELRERELGTDALDTLDSRNSLGVTLNCAGRDREAIPFTEETLKRYRATVGPDHRHSLTCMANLALCYQSAGQPDRMVTLLEEVFERQKATLSLDHYDTLHSMANLASAYWSVRRLDKSIPLFEQTVKLYSAKMGSNHNYTLIAKTNLAANYLGAGRRTEAITLLEESIDPLKATFGPDSPAVLAAMGNLALGYHNTGRNERALALWEESLRLSKEKFDPDHPSVLTDMNNLAAGYAAQKQWDRALPLWEETVRLRKAKFGIDNRETLGTMTNLATGYEDAGQPARAELIWRELADYQKGKSGADSMPYAGALAGLGDKLLKQKKHLEAETILRECLAIGQKKAADFWATFNTKSMLGDALLGQKKYAEAEPLLVQGYEGMKEREAKIPAEARMLLAKALERLVNLFDARGKKPEADEWRKKLETLKKNLLKQNPSTTDVELECDVLDRSGR